LRRHGVEVALSQHDEIVATDLDLVPIVRAEQHVVTDLGAAHVRPEGHDLGPHEPLRHLRRRRNEDAPSGLALAVLLAQLHQQAVVEHLDRKLLVDVGHEREGTVARVESIQLTTSDGHTLDADVAAPGVPSRGGVVVCHPHPQFGGDRFNPVVDAVFQRLPVQGFTTLRFDFRADYGGGVDERIDVVAALDELERRDVGPMAIVGYSFGAVVGLATADERVTTAVAIAPPLAAMPIDPPSIPVLLLIPRHDQLTSPDTVAALTSDWSNAEIRTIESADHFLVGQADLVAASAGEWIAARR